MKPIYKILLAAVILLTPKLCIGDTVIDYMVVSGCINFTALREELRREISNGWQPLGGLAVERGCYYQAMVRYEGG